MIPSLNITRYAGTAHFNEEIAMAALKELWTHLSGVIAGGTVSAEYQAMIRKVKPFVRLWYLKEETEADDDSAKVCPEAVGALLKYWVGIAWGEDLHVHPVDNSVIHWKVTDKTKKYGNRESILPIAQASLAAGQFREYRPATTSPGKYRLIEGTGNWWFTDDGTHGTVAECRAADWYVWPKVANIWRRWVITGATSASGTGVASALNVGFHSQASLADLTDREAVLVKMLKVNASQFDDGDVTDETAPDLFGSQVMWDDAGNPDFVAALANIP